MEPENLNNSEAVHVIHEDIVAENETFVDSTQVTYKRFTPEKLLIYSLILCLLAYGACATGDDLGYGIGTVLNLSGAITAFLAIVRVFTYKKSNLNQKKFSITRVLIVLLSLAVVGWGGCFGLIAFF